MNFSAFNSKIKLLFPNTALNSVEYISGGYSCNLGNITITYKGGDWPWYLMFKSPLCIIRFRSFDSLKIYVNNYLRY